MSDADKLKKRTFPTWGAVALTATGAILVGLAVNSALQPAAMPYEKIIADAKPEAYKAVALQDAGPAMPVKKLEWRTPGVHEALATTLVATDTDGRNVSLEWQNNVTEPVFFADLNTDEVGKVLTAIQEHVPEDAVVLSWWDLSRKIRLIAQRQAPLDDPGARGLIVPTAWSSVSDRVGTEERAYWGKGVPESDGENFTSFIDALLLDESKGAEALRALAPGKDIFVAVHLSDVWKAAVTRPDRIEIAYKDFPGSGQSHGVMRGTQKWIREQNIDGGYAVDLIGNAVRLHYLKDKSSSDMLITKMLPFSTSNPLELEDLKLVYQHRGFWIYKLKAESEA